MNLLLASALDITVILAVAVGAATLLRRQPAALRHWLLATAIVCASGMPLLELLVPAWHLPVGAWSQPAAGQMTLTSNTPPAATALWTPPVTQPGVWQRAIANLGRVLMATWLAGFVIALTTLLVGLYRLRRVSAGARSVIDGPLARTAAEAQATLGVSRRIDLLQSAHPALVVTWGLLRPKVLLPAGAEQWDTARLRIVLVHELAHVRRGDWAMQMLAALLRCACWFNPLVWIACDRLRHESERACDDVVLAAGVDGTEYATHLLAVARDSVRLRHGWTPATAIAQPSTLEGRIRAMLNTGLNRYPVGRAARLLTTAVLAVAAFVIAAGSTAARTQPAAATTDIALTIAAAAPTAAPARPAAIPERVAPAAAPQAPALAPGVIAGTVYDQLRGFLPGADVSLRQNASGATYTATTDRTGSFSIGGLRAGDYTIAVALPGFQIASNVLTVGPGETVRRSITLSLGTLQETISVVGGASDGEPRTAPTPRRPSAAAAATTFSAGFPGGMGGQIKVPMKVRNVNPVYPAGAQANGVSGVVTLVARIGTDGYIADVAPAGSTGDSAPHPDLITSAIDAVRQWQFTPTLLNNVPVEVTMKVSVSYSLR